MLADQYQVPYQLSEWSLDPQLIIQLYGLVVMDVRR